VHKKTRSDMMVKYFAEKVNPGIHDIAAKKEGLGVWKEGFLHERFAQEQQFLQVEMEGQVEQERMRREQLRKEHVVHAKTRSDMMVKYFAEKVSPGVHDVAAKKEGLGVWKEGFMHTRFAVRFAQQDEAARLAWERERQEHLTIHELHKKTRKTTILK
jgi:hypothetical protein